MVLLFVRERVTIDITLELLEFRLNINTCRRTSFIMLLQHRSLKLSRKENSTTSFGFKCNLVLVHLFKKNPETFTQEFLLKCVYGIRRSYRGEREGPDCLKSLLHDNI